MKPNGTKHISHELLNLRYASLALLVFSFCLGLWYWLKPNYEPLVISLALILLSAGLLWISYSIIHLLRDMEHYQYNKVLAEERYQLYFDYSNEAVLLLTPDKFQIRDCNPAASELLGYKPGQLQDKHFSDLLSADSPPLEVFVNQVLSREIAYTEDFICLQKDGSRLYCGFSGSIIRILEQPLIVLNLRNIQLQKHNDQLIRQLARGHNRGMDQHFLAQCCKHLCLALNGNQALIALLDENNHQQLSSISFYQDGHIANPVTFEIKNSLFAEALNKQTVFVPAHVQQQQTLPDIFKGQSVNAFAAASLRNRKNQSIGVVSLMSRDLLYDEKHTLSTLALVSEHISREMERSEVLKTLRDSELRFHDFANVAADWFWETDADQRFTYVSSRHMELTGWRHEQLINHSMHEVYSQCINQESLDNWHQQLQLMSKHEMFNVEIRLLCPDQKERYLVLRAIPIFSANATFSGYRGVGRNITKQRQVETELRHHRDHLEQIVESRTKALEQAQQALLRKERLATIGQLIATVGHELRNPLGIVSNASFLLKRHLDDDDKKSRKYLRLIDNGLSTADQIINDLLETTRTKAPHVQRIELKRLFDEMHEELEPSMSDLLEYKSREDYSLNADLGQLKQILSNLVKNAAEELNFSGRIVIETDDDDNYHRIIVSDNGRGIADDQQEQVFEALHTTKPKGNGLGLWISRKLSERHGGRLILTRSRYGGASFEIGIPIGLAIGILPG